MMIVRVCVLDAGTDRRPRKCFASLITHKSALANDDVFCCMPMGATVGCCASTLAFSTPVGLAEEASELRSVFAKKIYSY